MRHTLDAIQQEVSYLRDSAPDFARIIENVPNLVYVFDHRNGSNAYANRSIGDMLGYSVAEVQKMGGDLMTSLIHASDLPLVLAHFDAIRRLTGNQVATVTYRVRHKSGAWRWLFSHDTVFARGSDGTVTHHIGTAFDITAQKEAEQTALRAEQAAKATNEELMQFSYAMSHDMKAPSNTLSLILSELRLSIAETASRDATELLSLADDTVARMKTLVDDTLDYAQTVDAVTKLAPVDLNIVLADIKKILRADIHAFCGELNISPLPVVSGNESQLILLFQNLIENALKFHRPGMVPVIHVSASARDIDGGVTLSVQDNGIGIPPEKQSQVFHLFKRLSNEDASKSSGIGLATCRRVAMNHGTELCLRSDVNVGSNFSIRLKQL